MSDLRTRLEDMRDFCEGASGDRRPHPNNVAKLCRDILEREERRTKIVSDIRDHIAELQKCRGATVYAGKVADVLIGIADRLDGKEGEKQLPYTPDAEKLCERVRELLDEHGLRVEKRDNKPLNLGRKVEVCLLDVFHRLKDWI